jgi:ABC-type branched-subunit amino acid transport system ATPase component
VSQTNLPSSEPVKKESIITEAARTARSQEPTGKGDGAILRTDKATIRFGGLIAVNELTMNVRQGEIYGLIGPNGAGKTTIFNLLTGVYKPTSGEIYFQDKRIDGLRPYEISRRGVSRTFQNIRLFPGMPPPRTTVARRCRAAYAALSPRRAGAQRVLPRPPFHL